MQVGPGAAAVLAGVVLAAGLVLRIWGAAALVGAIPGWQRLMAIPAAWVALEFVQFPLTLRAATSVPEGLPGNAIRPCLQPQVVPSVGADGGCSRDTRVAMGAVMASRKNAPPVRPGSAPKVVSPRNKVTIAFPFSRLTVQDTRTMTAGDWISLASLAVSVIGFSVVIARAAQAAHPARQSGSATDAGAEVRRPPTARPGRADGATDGTAASAAASGS